MKPLSLVVALILSASGTSYAADKHGHDHKPLHGGVVAEVKDIDYELVAKPDVLQLHVRDHGKALDVSGATAKVTLLSGKDRQGVELKPAGNRLEAKGGINVAAGTKAVAQGTIGGKAFTVRFVLK